jgi:hypothetical protein
LQNFSPNPIWVTKNRGKKDSTPGSWIKLLHYPFFKEGLVSYRTVLVNEVCIEQDFKKWSNQYLWGNRILNTLKEMKIPHLMCHSGGKGLHFHVFFDAHCIEQVTGYKQLREKIWHYILNWSDVPDSLRGLEKPYDITAYSFSDTSQGHLIRELGGHKRQRKRIITKIPKANEIISGDVIYPKKIPVWKVPVDVLRSLNLEPKYPLSDCRFCQVKIPPERIVLDSFESALAPIWIGCLICKKRL